MAALDGEPLWGLDEDVEKYYDSIGREITWQASIKLRLPEWFADSRNQFRDEPKRCFKYGRALGESTSSWNDLKATRTFSVPTSRKAHSSLVAMAGRK